MHLKLNKFPNDSFAIWNSWTTSRNKIAYPCHPKCRDSIFTNCMSQERKRCSGRAVTACNLDCGCCTCTVSLFLLYC